MKPKGLTGPAWKKQVASSVRLFQESRGFGLRDSKRCNPGSDDTDELRLGQSGDREGCFRHQLLLGRHPHCRNTKTDSPERFEEQILQRQKNHLR
jgi:hypothetical protein